MRVEKRVIVHSTGIVDPAASRRFAVKRCGSAPSVTASRWVHQTLWDDGGTKDIPGEQLCLRETTPAGNSAIAILKNNLFYSGALPTPSLIRLVDPGGSADFDGAM